MSQSPRDLVIHRIVQHSRATQIAAALLRHPRSQVARPCCPVLELTGSSDPEPLLGSLVGLHFGHGNTRHPIRVKFRKSRIVSALAAGEKGESSQTSPVKRARVRQNPILAPLQP